MAVNKLGNALASGGSTFESDDDPDLVGQALPFSLKLMESLEPRTRIPDAAGRDESVPVGLSIQTGHDECVSSDLPFYAILMAGVPLITYVPWITLAPLEWFGK
jgi:hypothetical protein